MIFFFFIALVALGLWHRIFILAGLDWVASCSMVEMITSSFKDFRNHAKGKVLCCIASVSLIWSIWWKRNPRIFSDAMRTMDAVWDLFYSSLSLWASTSKAFRVTPLSLILLDWSLLCKSKRVKKTWQVWLVLIEGVVE